MVEVRDPPKRLGRKMAGRFVNTRPILLSSSEPDRGPAMDVMEPIGAGRAYRVPGEAMIGSIPGSAPVARGHAPRVPSGICDSLALFFNES
jgi:hypothetical protein